MLGTRSIINLHKHFKYVSVHSHSQNNSLFNPTLKYFDLSLRRYRTMDRFYLCTRNMVLALYIVFAANAVYSDVMKSSNIETDINYIASCIVKKTLTNVSICLSTNANTFIFFVAHRQGHGVGYSSKNRLRTNKWVKGTYCVAVSQDFTVRKGIATQTLAQYISSLVQFFPSLASRQLRGSISSSVTGKSHHTFICACQVASSHCTVFLWIILPHS